MAAPAPVTYCGRGSKLSEGEKMIGAKITGATPEGRQYVRRLMISNMTLENFKSYAGAQNIGPFHKKFSAIVGPNGSGKSNVIDAMLFVFGKRAKQIRLDKISSLIHKSDKHPKLREGRVSVFFREILDFEDSDDDFAVVAGTELVVARSATAAGSSVYYVNNSRSSYDEVTKLLRAKGIDLDHNRFLILQGEVEQISLMQPKGKEEGDVGLLEYIEDIVGTQHYRGSIAAAGEAVEALTGEREVHIRRVDQAEADRAALDDAKKEAEVYLRGEVKLGRQRAVFIQMKLAALRAELEEKTRAATAAREALEDERRRGGEAKAALQVAEKEASAEAKACDGLVKRFEKVQAAYRALDANAAKQRAEREHADQQAAKAKADLKKAAADVERTEVQIKKAEAQLAENSAELGELTTRVAADQAEYAEQTEALQNKMRPFRQEFEAIKKRVAPVAEAVSQAEQRVRLLTSKKDIARNDSAAKDIAAKLEAEQRNKAEAGSKLADLREQVQRDAKEHTQRAAEAQTVGEQLEKLKACLPNIRAKEQSHLASVETLKKQFQDMGAEGTIVKALKRLKARLTETDENLDGYYGRLGDLGSIGEKYNTAIAAAAGGYLQCLVVDNEKTAKRIIAHLKQTGGGRASILLLDHQERAFGAKVAEKFSAPDGTVRLFDQIKPSHKRFAPVFYHAMKDTLVAETIDTATEIAYSGGGAGGGRRQHRVVTLLGEVIDTSGTITGGGKVNTQGQGMRSYQVSGDVEKQLREELLRHQKELEQAHTDGRAAAAQVQEMKAKHASLSAQVRELQSVRRARESELRLEEERVEAVDQRLAALATEKGLLDAKTAADASEIARVEEELHAEEEGLATAREEKQVMDAALEAVQAKMSEAAGAEYTQLEAAIKEGRERTAYLEKKVSTDQAAEAAGRKAIVERRRKVEAAEKAQAKAQEKVASLATEDLEEDGKVKEARLEVEAAKKLFGESKKRLEKLNKARDKCRDETNKLKQEESGLAHTAKDRDAEVQATTAQTGRLSNTLDEIDGAIRRSIEQYGVAVLPDQDVGNPATFDPASYTVRLSAEDLEGYEATHVKREIQRLEETQKALTPNVKALAEWREKDVLLKKKTAEKDAVTARRDEAQDNLDQLRKTRHEEFMAGFKAITYKLKEMYQMLTMGGDAELELCDTFDPFTEGLQLSVRPPKKSWKSISNLSGGEKTLSSLALVFALHHFKPTPLYVMDEIDAALDFKNVVCKKRSKSTTIIRAHAPTPQSIVANYVTSAASNAQFIIISLRNNMFELANRLVGITKTENCTRR